MTTVAGGTVTVNGDYTVRTFETAGTLTVSGGTLADVQYLLVAGGGNAALPQSTYVAGGGAGGVLTGNITINTGSYPVIVGAPGNNSSFLNMTANGGGQGGFYGNGSAGGSGGGGGTLGVTHIRFQNFVGGGGVPGQGYAGGAPAGGGYPPFGPGGGGGAAGPGGQGTLDGQGGRGGVGIPSDITGNMVYYAGGGSGRGPGGVGLNGTGYTGYGAGGGYDMADGPTYYERLPAQPGVLIIRYASNDPANNLGGIPLTYIAGLPQDLYPGVNVAGSDVFGGGSNAQFIIQTTATYGVPVGFTFLDSWQWETYDPSYVAVTTTAAANDTATANNVLSNNAVLGNIAIAPGTKVMFSVDHSVWSGAPDYDGVGVGSATAIGSEVFWVNDTSQSLVFTNDVDQPLVWTTTRSDNFLGINDQGLAVYDDGAVWSDGNNLSLGPYAPFETDGQIIDVAIDTVHNKMWYRVDGGAWQG